MLKQLFVRINASQPQRWHSYLKSIKEALTQPLMPWVIQRCMHKIGAP
jgi:hypothetical protein